MIGRTRFSPRCGWRSSAGWWPTCPSDACCPGGVDSSLIVGLLAEAGQHGLATFSIGFESVGGVKGDEFRYSDIIAERFGTDHHQIRIGTDRMLPALDGAIDLDRECVPTVQLRQDLTAQHRGLGDGDVHRRARVDVEAATAAPAASVASSIARSSPMIAASIVRCIRRLTCCAA